MSDRRIQYDDDNDGIVDYAMPDVLTATDYYPFGQAMAARGYLATSSSSYRYSINRQEKEPELNSNITSAKFWEYDSRLGRRWNLDPVYNTDISRYAVNGNNPNYFLDPNGDFKTKFGAKWHRFWNGTGGTVEQNTNSGSKRAGEWFIQKDSETGAKGSKKGDLQEIIIHAPIYGPNPERSPKGLSGGLWAPNVDDMAGAAENVYDYFKDSRISANNIPRALVADYYTFSVSSQAAAFLGKGKEGTLILQLRGDKPGIYYNTTVSAVTANSIGIDVGFSFGGGYFVRDANTQTAETFAGDQTSYNAGVQPKVLLGATGGGTLDVGFDNRGKITTVGVKFGLSGGLGFNPTPISAGRSTGVSTQPIPIILF